MARITGLSIGKKVCDALGLDVKRVNSIIIRIEADDYVTIEVTQLINQKELDQTIKVLKEYNLVEKKDDGKN